MLIATATFVVSCLLPSDTTLLLLSELMTTLLFACTLSPGTIPCIVPVLVLYLLKLVLHVLAVVHGTEALILVANITKHSSCVWHAYFAATLLLLCMVIAG